MPAAGEGYPDDGLFPLLLLPCMIFHLIQAPVHVVKLV